jgi:hypothetical protein
VIAMSRGRQMTLVMAALLIGLVLAPSARAVGARRADPAISTLPGPLSGVDALASNDVWAVGTAPDPADPDENNGLAMHWDGRSWKRAGTPSFGGLTGGLVDVSLSATNFGFAVGNDGIPGFRDQQIIVERWDGSRWTLSPAPDKSFNDVLTGVAVISSTDAWAVGAWDAGGTARNRPLIEHWDGTSWTIDPASDVGTSELDAVDAVASNDVWAVGTAGGKTLTMHWDGSAWSTVPSVNKGQATQGLADVSAVSADDVWAAGTVDAGQPFPGQTLVLHWDGAAWSVVASPSPSSGDIVTGIAGFSPSEAWMVGTFFPDAFTSKGLTEHFTSSGVQKVAIAGQTSLDGVAGVAPDDVWAVGAAIFHSNGNGWRLVVGPPPS